MTGAGPAQEAFQEALLEDDPELLYERAPCGYLSTTPEGRIVKVNQTFLTWTGHRREALVGRKTFVELLAAGGRIYHETHYAPMLRMQGAAREIALDVVTADGGRLPVLVNAVLERDPDGAPRVVRVALFDATERREYERELLREKDRAEESEARARALARTLQQTLIPPSPPHVPGLDVAAVYRPAGTGEEVGGDFYDVFQVADDDWVVVLGDVCGKGVDAAIVTALVRYTIRAVSVQTPDPVEALSRLNEVLISHDTDRFCTVVLLRLRRTGQSWNATISLGGHPLPVRLTEGGPAEKVGQPGPLVGAFPGVARTETEVPLRSGELLLLYTDGVTEGRRGRQMYGEERLFRVVGGHVGPAEALADTVLHDVLEFQENLARDDIAVVVVRVP
ncbi:MAG TPA: SpoIIE family protein phosphatase [Marmoricola sp.]|nr:SpoIIE family protein phosphatase [Marmoricola sp.]